MARYSVYNNILVKLDNFFLRIAAQVDKEITALLSEQKKLYQRMADLKKKVVILSYLKGSFELYASNAHHGKEVLCFELKNASSELERVLFKEYAIKQRVQELRDYKIVLSNHKNNFMKDPTIDGYTEALHQLEVVKNHFRRLIMHKKITKSAQDFSQCAAEVYSLRAGSARKPQTYGLH